MSKLRMLVRHFWPFGLTVPEVTLKDCTAIITGGNTGLGYATAEHFVRHGISTLVLACRNLDKGIAAKAKLLELIDGGEDACTIHVWELDLASFDSVTAFHKQAQQLKNIHFFIANAGVAPTKDWKLTDDGWEESFQVNVLSTGMLAHLILGEMAKTADEPKVRFKPHMVLVSSSGHYNAEFAQKEAPKILDALNDKSTYSSEETRPYEMYKISKLLTIQIAKELAVLPAATNVIINSCCPGFAATHLLDNQNMPGHIKFIFDKLAWSCEYAARGIVWCAVSDTSPGAYVQDGRELEPHPFIATEQGQDVQKKTWEEMVKLWIKKDADVRLIEASAP